MEPAWQPCEMVMRSDGHSSMTTRTECDAKLDAIERIIGQVRRYDGAQAADLIVYGKVPIKELAWTELEPEEIASAAMGGVTEEFRVVPLEWLRFCENWQDEDGDICRISLDGLHHDWIRYGQTDLSAEYIWCHNRSLTEPLRPLGRTWSQIESLAGGEGQR